jgi:hypothetical protein
MSEEQQLLDQLIEHDVDLILHHKQNTFDWDGKTVEQHTCPFVVFAVIQHKRCSDILEAKAYNDVPHMKERFDRFVTDTYEWLKDVVFCKWHGHGMLFRPVVDRLPLGTEWYRECGECPKIEPIKSDSVIAWEPSKPKLDPEHMAHYTDKEQGLLYEIFIHNRKKFLETWDLWEHSSKFSNDERLYLMDPKAKEEAVQATAVFYVALRRLRLRYIASEWDLSQQTRRLMYESRNDPAKLKQVMENPLRRYALGLYKQDIYKITGSKRVWQIECLVHNREGDISPWRTTWQNYDTCGMCQKPEVVKLTVPVVEQPSAFKTIGQREIVKAHRKLHPPPPPKKKEADETEMETE